MIRKILVGAAGAVTAVGLAAPAGADPVPPPDPSVPGLVGAVSASPAPPPTPSVPGFVGAVSAAGVTGTTPAMLEDGYAVCYRLWVRQMTGPQVAANFVQIHPQLTSEEAGQFVLAAYNNLCPVASDVVDYWAYSTGGAGGGGGGG